MAGPEPACGRAKAGLRQGRDLRRSKAQHCGIPGIPLVPPGVGEGCPVQAQFVPVGLFPSFFVKQCYGLQVGLSFIHGMQAPSQAGLIYNKTQTDPTLLHMLGSSLVVKEQNK